MSGYRESALKRSVLKALKAVPGLAVRKRWGSVYATVGDPDLTGCYQGRHFEIELKQPGEEPTRIQNVRMNEWLQAGAIVGCAHSVKEALDLLGIED